MRTCLPFVLLVSLLAPACGVPARRGDDTPSVDAGSDTPPPWQPSGVVTLHNGGHANGIATDGEAVYWVNNRADSAAIPVLKLELTTSTVTEVTPFTMATILTRGGDELFFADGLGAYNAVSLSGGATRLVVNDSAGGRWFAIDGDRIFWTAGTFVRSARTDGADQRDLATVQGANYIVVDATRVYVLGDTGLYAIPRQGGPAVQLTPEHTVDGNLAQDATDLYFSDRIANRIVRVPKAGPLGTFETIARNRPSPGRLASDGNTLYWVERPRGNNGAVMRLPHGATTPQLVATGFIEPSDLVLLPGAIVWTVWGGAGEGALMAAPR